MFRRLHDAFKGTRLDMKMGVGMLALAFSASGATFTASVDSKDMPWTWSNGGLNTSFQYGSLNGSGPAIINASDGVSFGAGSSINLSYVSGTTSTCGRCPQVDANGWTAASTGNSDPSKYISISPVYLMGLVGTFADSAGAIVGTPFTIGDEPASLLVPTGATQLQLGLNDDNFQDNSGSLNVLVSGAAAGTSTPEPATFLLLGAALCTGAGVRRLHRGRLLISVPIGMVETPRLQARQGWCNVVACDITDWARTRKAT